MVRILVKAEGGAGGFRGRGELWDLAGNNLTTGGLDLAGQFNTKYPSIWEGVYLMGWVWSLVECGVSWWTVRPEALAIEPDLETNHSSTIRNSRSEDSPRRPLLGKRTRSDYSGIMSDGEGSERRNLFGSFYRKKRDLGTLSFREDAHHHGLGNTTVQFASTLHTSTRPESTTTSTAHDDSTDATPTPRKLSDFDRPSIRTDSRADDRSSEHDYGDDEESNASISGRSSMDSTHYQSQTPLLSSSLPYDPEIQHPHEQQALLTNQYRQTSYSTLSDLGHISTTEPDDAIVEVHEDDASSASEPDPPNPTPTDDEPLHLIAGPKRTPLRRVYPSFPSYSSAYHHAHFSAATDSGNVSTAGSTAAPPPPATGDSCATTTDHADGPTERSIYGIGVQALPAYLPVLWRTSALLRHVSHALVFAWAPALVFDGRFQWWCALVLVLLCGKKGYHTVQWFGGAACRNGIVWSSAMTLFLAVVVYVTSLGIWDIGF
ncbi:hypothetical protein EDC01DRAFT_724314 [Geopyxis carbonaria]|nr:hypothetical protein EDC01DRAFT_724314 [Geopyxis carbonaria]